MTAHQYIEGLQLRHFAPNEILYLGASHASNGLNSLPPPNLWPNIVQTCWIADLARAELDTPLRVLSGYRNSQYNSAVGGASQSLHKEFRALDLATSKVDDLSELLLEWRDCGVFHGGIGIYHSFVHVDTRGHNSTWRG